jgi:putative Ca2+/H+ antiporter (TMEM165/GDT1 family)
MLFYLLIGALLAQRFKMLVLVPGIALTALVAAMMGYHYGASAWHIVGAVVLDIISLQVGYLVGAGIHYVLTAVLAKSTDHRALDGSVSHRHAAH